MINLASRIPIANLLIPRWLINPSPQTKIATRQFCVLLDVNNPERYRRRLDEIVYDVSETMAVLP